MHIRAAAAHLRRRSNQAFAAFGMTTDQYVLLTVLAEHRKATQQELVGWCFSDTATIGAMVSLLEVKGLVTRTPHPQDRRALNVRLTQPGLGLAKEMRRSSSNLRAELTSLFSKQELPLLLEFLARMAGAMRPAGRRTSGVRSHRQHLTSDEGL
jgi:DNA-binding MarR family transcriptional regulator